jgi:curved DNA-binding protein CbpA
MSKPTKPPRSLYDTLGVERTALPETIKAAFRKSAKAAHPDTGGSAEEFEEVKRAHLVLSDAARRAKYDATGEIDEPVVDQTDSQAMSHISQVLTTIIQDERHDPAAINIIEAMKSIFQTNIDEHSKKLASLIRAKARAIKIQKRFKRKAKGLDPKAKGAGGGGGSSGGASGSAHGGASGTLFDRVLTHKIRETEAQILQVERQKASFVRALEMIEDYDFEVDTAAMIPMFQIRIG